MHPVIYRKKDLKYLSLCQQLVRESVRLESFRSREVLDEALESQEKSIHGIEQELESYENPHQDAVCYALAQYALQKCITRGENIGRSPKEFNPKIPLEQQIHDGPQIKSLLCEWRRQYNSIKQYAARVSSALPDSMKVNLFTFVERFGNEDSFEYTLLQKVASW